MATSSPTANTESYPAVLERLSQGRFAVGNFGVNGATALKHPARDWTRTAACRDALAFAPAIVVVMLGINDLAFPDQYAQYPADLRDIVVALPIARLRPARVLCTLTPIAPEDQQAHANRIIRETMIPAIRAVAAETGARLIDIHAAFPNRIELLPDGLHPSPAGAELIARTVLAAIDAVAAGAANPAGPGRPVPWTSPSATKPCAARQRAELWLKTQPPPTASARSARAVGKAAISGLPKTWPNSCRCWPVRRPDPATILLLRRRVGATPSTASDAKPSSWPMAARSLGARRCCTNSSSARRSMPAAADIGAQPEAEDAAEPVRSTAYALQAIATALGE